MRKVSGKWLAVAVFALCVMATSATHAQGSISLQVFYDELQPYGTWIDHGRYGYVWMPNAGSDFIPYRTNGYWVQTTYGNTWVSNYNWGWAPFHYGRWFYDDFYGWLWVPDTTWGPAWVTWRSGGGYYGWAPLMPGLSVSVSVGYYSHIPDYYWSFVPYRYVMYRQVYRHCLPRPRVNTVIHHTTVIVNNNYYSNDGRNGRDRRDDRGAYFTGPSRTEIESRTRERVPVYEVHDRRAPGQTDISRNSVSFYKPAVDQNTRTRALPAQYTRDDEKGRESITERRRQSVGGASSPYGDYRESIRSSQNSQDNERHSLRESDAIRNSEPRDAEALRRSQPTRESRSDVRGTNDDTPGNTMERIQRDREFNNNERQREITEQRRQQTDVQMRQRSNQSEELRQYNEQRQREMGEQRQRQMDMIRQQRESQNQRPEQNQRQRSTEQYQQQSPSRQPGQIQRSPSTEQRRTVAPSQQRDPSQMQRISPQNRGGSGAPAQQRSNSQSSSRRTRAN